MPKLEHLRVLGMTQEQWRETLEKDKARLNKKAAALIEAEHAPVKITYGKEKPATEKQPGSGTATPAQ